MAQDISSMFAMNFSLDSTQTLKWRTDTSLSEQSVTIPTGSYRFWLVNTGSSAGTTDNPWCVLQKTRELSTNYFNWSLNSEGKVQIQYLGPVTGSINFATASILQTVLGFTSSLLQFNSGTIQTATYQPYGVVYVAGRPNDTNWQRTVSQTAYQELPTGEVYGWSDDYIKSTRQYDLRFLPTDETFKTELNTDATPALPVSKSNWNVPPLVNNNYQYPFTLSHFLYGATGKPVAVCHSTYQQNISNSDRSFDVVYIRPKTLEAKEQFIPSIKGFRKWTDFREFAEILSSSGERQTYTAPTLTSSPENVANIFAWYSGDYTETSGTSVNKWLDKSGYGRHVTQSIAAAKPSVATNISYNNQPVLSFDGGDHLGIDTAATFGLAQPFTVYLVGEQGPTATSYATYFDSSTSDRALLRKDTSNTVLNIFAGTTLTGSINQNTKQVTAVVYNGASTTVYNSASVSQFSGNAGTQTLGRPLVGIGQSSVYPLTGKIAELIFFTGSHNSSDRTKVLDYLETKYWSPSSIPDMHAWWSARSVTTVDGLVSQINDLSGRERHLVQSTESRRPVYISSVSSLKNQPTVQFAGSQQMATAAAHSLPSSCTVFFVLGNIVNRGMIIEHGNGSSLYLYSTGNAAIAKFSGGSSHRTFQNPRTTWMTEYQQGSGRYNSSAAPVMRGGTYGSIADLTATSTDGSAITATIATSWYMGARLDFSLAHNGMISEVIVYERALSTAELERVEKYLNDIYGV
jgi:hypothetical protein